MPLSMRPAGLIRALLYPVVWERDPCALVDRVVEITVDRRALDGTPDEYLAAVRAALASDEPLTDLLPQDHDEATVRRFLAEVADRLERR